MPDRWQIPAGSKGSATVMVSHEGDDEDEGECDGGDKGVGG